MFEATVIAIGLVGAAALAFGALALRQASGGMHSHADRGEAAGDGDLGDND